MTSRQKEAIIMGIGILTGITLCGPAAQAATTAITATLSSQAIYVDGRQVSMTAYAIGGHNYVKLRDVAEAVNFNAYWDSKAVQIESDKPYTGEAPASQTSPSLTDTQNTGDGYLANGKSIARQLLPERLSTCSGRLRYWGSGSVTGTVSFRLPCRVSSLATTGATHGISV